MNSNKSPWYIQLGLIGIKSRKTALIYFWFSIILSCVCLVLGFFSSKYFVGVLFFLAAFWYWKCIQWADENGGWNN